MQRLLVEKTWLFSSNEGLSLRNAGQLKTAVRARKAGQLDQAIEMNESAAKWFTCRGIRYCSTQGVGWDILPGTGGGGGRRNLSRAEETGQGGQK
jgi:hypothetical protein